MRLITLSPISLETPSGVIDVPPGSEIMPESTSEGQELVNQGYAVELQEVPITTKLQHEAVCPDGPQSCGVSKWRSCLATEELEWFCMAKTEWCWKSEILT